MRLIPFAEGFEKKEEGARISDLEQLYLGADEMRKRAESDWLTNCLFLAGNQWETAATEVNLYRKIEVKAPNSKVKLISHQILPLVRQAQAALTENLAQQIASPATQDQLDVDAAELATDLVQSLYYTLNEQNTRFHEILWAMCCGQVMRWSYWDPDGSGIGVMGPMDGVGDIKTEMLNPWRYHVSPWVDNSGEAPWVIVSDVRDTDEIADIFPGKEVQPEEYAYAMQMLDSLLSNVVEDRGGGGVKRRQHAAILKQLFVRPTAQYPKGRHIVWANKKLLHESELAEGWFPFVPLRWFPIPGRVYPLPFVSPLRDLQKEINITLSQLIEVKNRQLRNDMAVHGANAPTFQTDAETGRKTIMLSPDTQAYEFLRYDLKTSDAEILLGKLWSDMMGIAGIHESTIGQHPSTAVTATQLQMLRESDLSGLTIFRSGFDLAHSQIAKQEILMAREHYQIPRVARYASPDGGVKVRAFFGTDLRHTEDVRPRSVPLVTQGMAQQLRREAAAQGLYGPYMGPEDMLAKVTALLSSGIPDIQQEVDILLAPMTLGELRQLVAKLNAAKAQLALIQAEGAIDAMVLQKQQQEMQAQMMTAQTAPGGEGQPPQMALPAGGAG